MHSGTFNPQDFALARLNADTRSGDNIPVSWLAKQPGMVGVRLRCEETGCAGFGYVLTALASLAANDLLFEHDGAKLFVPRCSDAVY